jgi:hypothetical protein
MNNGGKICLKARFAKGWLDGMLIKFSAKKPLTNIMSQYQFRFNCYKKTVGNNNNWNKIGVKSG